MENNSVNAVDTLSPSALTPELMGQIERDALSETALLAPRCRKILRMLREGAALERIQPELWHIQRALSAPGGLAAAAAGEQPASLTSSERSLALDALVSELRAGAAAARIAVLRRKLFFTIREAAEYSGLPLCSIRRMVARNLLPAVKLGAWRIKRTYLEMLDLRHLRRLADDRAERTPSAPARRAMNARAPSGSAVARPSAGRANAHR